MSTTRKRDAFCATDTRGGEVLRKGDHSEDRNEEETAEQRTKSRPKNERGSTSRWPTPCLENGLDGGLVVLLLAERARSEGARYRASVSLAIRAKEFALPFRKVPRLLGHTVRVVGAACLFGLSGLFRSSDLSGVSALSGLIRYFVHRTKSTR